MAPVRTGERLEIAAAAAAVLLLLPTERALMTWPAISNWLTTFSATQHISTSQHHDRRLW
jgi:hypothetical protein